MGAPVDLARIEERLAYFRTEFGDRECFLELERLTFAAKKWRLALEVYDLALEGVEQGTRAFRRVDLLSRRARLLAARLAQPGEAAATYLKVVELEPDNDEHMRRLERLCLSERDFGGLVRAYERRAALQQSDKARVESLRRAARTAAAKLRDTREAARLYELVLEIAPADDECHQALEPHYEQVHNWHGLVKLFETRASLADRPEKSLELRFRVAAILEEELRDPLAAMAAYRKILEANPGNERAIETLARLLEATSSWMELVEVTREQLLTVKERHKKGLLYFKCGSIMEAKFGRQDEAIRYYEAAIQSSPLCLPAVHSLRDIYTQRAAYNKVAETLELEAKLWSGQKERASVLALLGDTYRDKLAQPERALECYHAALTADPDCLAANVALFDIHMARGEYTHARPFVTLLMRKSHLQTDHGERAQFFVRSARLAEAEGQFKDATEYLRSALALQPTDMSTLELLLALMRTAPRSYNYAGLLIELEEGYQRHANLSGRARVLVGRAHLLADAGHPLLAEQLYENAYAMAPHDFIVCQARAESLLALGREREAKALVEAHTQNETADRRGDALAYLADLALELGDFTVALRAAEAALAAEPLRYENHARRSLLLAIHGRASEATSSITRAIQLAEEAPRKPTHELALMHAHLARLALAGDQQKEAERALGIALQLEPAQLTATLITAQESAKKNGLSSVLSLLQSALTAQLALGPVAEARFRQSLARFYTRHGEPLKAIAQREKVLEQALVLSAEQLHMELLLLLESQLKAGAAAALVTPLLQSLVSQDFRSAAVYRLWASFLSAQNQPAAAQRALDVEKWVASEFAVWSADEAKTSAPPADVLEELAAPHARKLPVRLAQQLADAVALAWPPSTAPARSAASSSVVDSLRTSVRSFIGKDVEVMTGNTSTYKVAAIDGTKPRLVFETGLLDAQTPELAFHVGQQFLGLKLGCSYLQTSAPAQRAVIINTIVALATGQDVANNELGRHLGKKTLRAIERIVIEATADERASLTAETVAQAFAELETASARITLWVCRDLKLVIDGLIEQEAARTHTDVALVRHVSPLAQVAYLLTDYLSPRFDRVTA